MNKRRKLTLSIDKKILDAYKKYAEKEGINISRRLEKYMRKELKIK